MSIRVRGIYATALTELFDDVVQASGPIEERFEDSFSMEPADVRIETTSDRQGIGVHGAPEAVERAVSTLQSLAIDTLAWRAKLPLAGVFAGEVTETLGSGAIVECVPGSVDSEPGDGSVAEIPPAGSTSGFLPYSKTSSRVEEDDTLRVQVREPRAPWDDGRPVLDTTIRIPGGVANLVRGTTGQSGQPELADIVPADPPSGWALDWAPSADDASLDELGATIESLGERATKVEDGLAEVEPPETAAPERYYRGEASCWLWFGRNTRFELDSIRGEVTETMPGHHRIKAATEAASTAVDFVEAVCDEPAGTSEAEFPFDATTVQFGPSEGETIGIGHGKPDGRLIELGSGEVTEMDDEGNVTVEREMSSRGSYDALGTDREPGDVAVTKFKEGRWWYPTTYRGASGASKGTYVNICTPVEIFPETIRYVDLHVDVIKRPDGTVERVDDDELAAAVEAGTVPETLAEKAQSVAAAIEKAF